MTIEKPEDVCLDLPLEQIWEQALSILEKTIKGPFLDAWVRGMTLSAINQSQATFSVANSMALGWLQNAKHAKNAIADALEQITGRNLEIEIKIDPTVKPKVYTPSIASITVAPDSLPAGPGAGFPSSPKRSSEHGETANFERNLRSEQSNLNPKHIFETFVVGSSNRFCHSASMAVADKPGASYNPLFLYGGVGLGKTHLLHAIGNHILRMAPNTVVRYLTCEKFTNDVVNSIRQNDMIQFRKKYRTVDLLLMDDIQFIEGKEATQEEFFHTFNALRDSGKQIVLTSDRPPKALGHLEERLRSRFEWGLIADIQPPDYEMRLAILSKKADQEGMAIPEDVLAYIARSFSSNIRELEGALLRAHAFGKLTGEPLTMLSVMQVLQTGNQRKARPQLTIDQLIDAVSSYYKVESSDLKSSKRSQDLTVPRHIAMYLAHEILLLSYPRVGQAFGNRKHTSALYAYDKVKQSISEDPEIARAVGEISRQLDR
jgi:chromosomal replication initiator protein